MYIIGLKRPPHRPPGTVILIVTDHPDDGARMLIRPVNPDQETVTPRAPNHLEARRLGTRDDEAVVEVRHRDGTTEVFRSSRVTFSHQPYHPMADSIPDTIADASILLDAHAPVAGPDLDKPYWRHIYDDIKSDILTGRLRPGDEIPSPARLAYTYLVPISAARKALRRLHTDGLTEGRRGLGTFVTDPLRKGYR